MTDADLDDMFRLLGDAEVMRYYPRAKSRNEVRRWINWSKDNYATHGFGLWVIEHWTTGDFIGDCGLTWQNVDGQEVLEVGYHVLPEHQGQGLATEGPLPACDTGSRPWTQRWSPRSSTPTTRLPVAWPNESA